MIEVEVKLPIADLDTIKRKLLKMGFKETAVIEVQMSTTFLHC